MMETKMYIPRAILSNANTASHAVYDHLHFDIQHLDASILKQIERFIAETGDRLSWQDFKRVSYEEIAGQLADHADEDLARLLSDPQLYGAPNSHLTAKFTGVPVGERYEQLLDLFEKGSELMTSLPTTGYVEGERVSFRVEFSGGEFNLSRTPTLCPVREIKKVCLESVGRQFRTTEVHISFERLHLVHPKLLADLFSQGFYTAFRLDEDTGSYNVIATIQGFELEITEILVDMLRWLEVEAAAGGIGCPVVIKKEDITRYYVFGSQPKLQKVVEPRL